MVLRRIPKMSHFKPEEFKCKCGYNCGLGYDDMDTEFIDLINAARTIARTPFIINSAIRCMKHNKDVGSTSTSSHLKGLAVDIAYSSSNQCFRIVEALLHVGITRIGLGKNFIHCDIDIAKESFLLFNYY